MLEVTIVFAKVWRHLDRCLSINIEWSLPIHPLDFVGGMTMDSFNVSFTILPGSDSNYSGKVMAPLILDSINLLLENFCGVVIILRIVIWIHWNSSHSLLLSWTKISKPRQSLNSHIYSDYGPFSTRISPTILIEDTSFMSYTFYNSFTTILGLDKNIINKP